MLLFIKNTEVINSLMSIALQQEEYLLFQIQQIKNFTLLLKGIQEEISQELARVVSKLRPFRCICMALMVKRSNFSITLSLNITMDGHKLEDKDGE